MLNADDNRADAPPNASGGALERRLRDAPSSDGGRAHYGLNILPPWSAVVELVTIVGLLLAIDWIWPSLDIHSLQPSPYWVPVLLLSLQYGTASGSLAVVVAIAAYFAFVILPEQGVGENEFAYRLRILAQPIMWIATAVFVGQFRMVQISAKREMTRRVAELEAQTQTLADYANRLRGRCDVLEREIVSRAPSGHATLLDGLSALDRGPLRSLAAHEALLATALPGAVLSVFLRHGMSFNKVVGTGWGPDAQWLTSLPFNHPLVAMVVGRKKALTVLHAGDDSSLAGQGLVAVPILAERADRVLGFIKVEMADSRLITLRLSNDLALLAVMLRGHLQETGSDVSLRTVAPADGVRTGLAATLAAAGAGR